MKARDFLRNSNSKYETCHGIELREKENPTSQIPKEWRLG